MIIAADANILIRLAHTSSPLHDITLDALNVLRTNGNVLRSVPQSVYEFWVVATRPEAGNGLGLSIAECETELDRLLDIFPILDDTPSLYRDWRNFVSTYKCHGKVAHDARYVAALRGHGVSHLLTFNVADFARYPDLTVLDPRVIAAVT